MREQPSDVTLIKAVFFDFDGVLTRDKTGSLTTLRYLSEQTGIDYVRIRGAFKPHNAGLIAGTTTHEAIWPSVCRELNCTIDLALLRKAFESTPLNDGMFRLARKLRKHLSVGIITDNKKDRIDHLKHYARLTSIFDPIVVSAEVGSGKRSTPIFERALAYLNITPGECVFIDNTPENLDVPNALGMGTIYFNDEQNNLGQLIATLDSRFGIRVATDA